MITILDSQRTGRRTRKVDFDHLCWMPTSQCLGQDPGALLTLSPELLDQKDVKEFFFIFLLT